MSINTINSLIEILIHFHTFKNVELINQGLYQIRTKIYNLHKNLKYYALPSLQISSKEMEDKKDRYNCLSSSNIIPSHISETTFEFISRSFLIRYSEEQIILDDFCLYRFYQPFSSLNSSLVFRIEVELFFSDSIINLNKTLKQNTLVAISNVGFKSVARQDINIEYVKNQYSESYIPIFFQDSFSSIINLSVNVIHIENSLMTDKNQIKDYMIDKIVDTKFSPCKNVIKTYKDDERTRLITTDNSEKEKPSFLREIIDQNYKYFVLNFIEIYFNLKIKFNSALEAIFKDNEKAKKEDHGYFYTKLSLKIYDEETDNVKVEILDKLEDMINFSDRISIWNLDYVTKRILYESNFIGGQIYQLWHKHIELMRLFPSKYNNYLKHSFLLEHKEDLLKFVIRIKVPLINLLISPDLNLSENYEKRCVQHRQFLTENQRKINIENVFYSVNPINFPILIEESYINDEIKTDCELINDLPENINICKSSPKQKFHLFVLVHGLQGHSVDMRYIKQNLNNIYPNSIVLVSTANQNDTETKPIEEMGVNLANEIKKFFMELYYAYMFDKITFVGHSLGGLIIRSALPLLKDFSNKCFSYISLSTPHLGYILTKSYLVDAGLWALKTYKNSLSLNQISLGDSKEIKDTYMYSLSEKEGLEWFTNVVFVSSHQDSYAPFESSRVQIIGKVEESDIRKSTLCKMANNILIKIKNLMRIDINFQILEKFNISLIRNIESYIGRTPHIQFLDNQNYMKILFNSLHSLNK